MEIWRDVLGYEGMYEVSSFGRVRSLSRFDSLGRFINGKVLSPLNGSKGYLSVNLYKSGMSKKHSIHRLVAISFLEHNRNVVGHKDHNKQNNNVNNLIPNYLQRENCSDYRKDVGVSFCKSRKKWISYISYKNKDYNLGRFRDKEIALKVRAEALESVNNETFLQWLKK